MIRSDYLAKLARTEETQPRLSEEPETHDRVGTKPGFFLQTSVHKPWTDPNRSVIQQGYIFRVDSAQKLRKQTLEVKANPQCDSKEKITPKHQLCSQYSVSNRSQIPVLLQKQEQKLALIRSYESSTNRDIGWHSPRHSTQRKLIGDFTRARFLASTARRESADSKLAKNIKQDSPKKDVSEYFSSSRLQTAHSQDRSEDRGAVSQKIVRLTSPRAVPRCLQRRSWIQGQMRGSSHLSRKGVLDTHPASTGTLRLDLT